MDREARKAFIEVFWMCVPEDSTDTDRSFNKLFSNMPEALARHNQEGISYSLGNSTTNSNTTNTSPRNSFQDLPSEKSQTNKWL